MISDVTEAVVGVGAVINPIPTTTDGGIIASGLGWSITWNSTGLVIVQRSSVSESLNLGTAFRTDRYLG